MDGSRSELLKARLQFAIVCELLSFQRDENHSLNSLQVFTDLTFRYVGFEELVDMVSSAGLDGVVLNRAADKLPSISPYFSADSLTLEWLPEFSISNELFLMTQDLRHDLKALENFIAIAIENNMLSHYHLRSIFKRHLSPLSMEMIGCINRWRLPEDLVERRLIFAAEAGL